MGVNDRTDETFRFRIATSQVLVPVTVNDGGGRFVTGLGPEDFRLFEDGVEQRVDRLLDEATPLTLAVVVDVSGSMRSKMRDAARALGELLDGLGERDRVFLLGFHRWVVSLQEPTFDHSLVADALSRFEPSGGTAMFDGIVEGLYRLYKLGPGTRRALVLLSDGFDNASVNTPRETVAAAKATGIPIYAVGIGETRKGLFGRLFADPTNLEFEGLDEIRLRELSETTGGRTYVVAELERQKTRTTPSLLARAFERLARELRFHYVLAYCPPASELDGRWHSIRVELARPDLFARHRPGYLALPLENAQRWEQKASRNESGLSGRAGRTVTGSKHLVSRQTRFSLRARYRSSGSEKTWATFSPRISILVMRSKNTRPASSTKGSLTVISSSSWDGRAQT